MINEITINFNNAIEMSRGELLSWVNELLKTNLNKIEQLGTGAIYCQLTDVLYPGKIPLSKVNWKAKYDYEFVTNFKILQQAFTKLGILKNVQVEKLVKCKYQDNLQFLQWFKKIFDNNGNSGRDYNPVQRRGDTENIPEKKNNNKHSQGSTSSKQMQLSNSKIFLDIGESSIIGGCASFLVSDRTDEDKDQHPSYSKENSVFIANPPNSPQANYKNQSSPWKQQLNSKAFEDQRQFYLRKFKEIEHLCEDWKTQRTSSQLIDQIRKIILVAPHVDWWVEQGEFVTRHPASDRLDDQDMASL